MANFIQLTGAKGDVFTVNKSAVCSFHAKADLGEEYSRLNVVTGHAFAIKESVEDIKALLCLKTVELTLFFEEEKITFVPGTINFCAEDSRGFTAVNSTAENGVVSVKETPAEIMALLNGGEGK